MTERQGLMGDEKNEGSEPVLGGPMPLVLAGFLVLVVVGGTVDLLLDRPTTCRSWHVAFEGTMVALSLSFALLLFRGWRRTARELGQANASLADSKQALALRQAERDAWRKHAEQALAAFFLHDLMLPVDGSL